MIKKGYQVLVLSIILLLIVGYIRIPQYKIHQGFSSCGNNYKYSEVYVIVMKPCDTTTVINNIVEQYRKMNGTPNKLTVKLYHCKSAIFKGEEYYTATFEYPENEVTEAPEVF
ncbi:hypothetical protein LK537_27470 [Lachnoclostridium pacaense]|uniref:hypothetical protein n=1 Tax=Enterocloster hominis (ex Hitch et al. 2024) TaxID=1917870 RepID=UPI001D10EDFB|nr:hypothetical protein [Lachnoclostridium pacaense]MCC2821040.1 hypothetical protein [Lachnoclostridium pacaense]